MSAAIGVLNRILRMLCRSLPMYLDSARPWSDNDDRSAWIVLARLIADQRTLARRVAQALLDEGAQPDPGPFPSAFAAMNDLSLAFVLERIVQRQRAEVEALAACVGELADAPRARALAEEVLGNAQGYLDIFKELKTKRKVKGS